MKHELKGSYVSGTLCPRFQLKFLNWGPYVGNPNLRGTLCPWILCRGDLASTFIMEQFKIGTLCRRSFCTGDLVSVYLVSGGSCVQKHRDLMSRRPNVAFPLARTGKRTFVDNRSNKYDEMSLC